MAESTVKRRRSWIPLGRSGSESVSSGVSAGASPIRIRRNRTRKTRAETIVRIPSTVVIDCQAKTPSDRPHSTGNSILPKSPEKLYVPMAIRRRSGP